MTTYETEPLLTTLLNERDKSGEGKLSTALDELIEKHLEFLRYEEEFKVLQAKSAVDQLTEHIQKEKKSSVLPFDLSKGPLN